MDINGLHFRFLLPEAWIPFFYTNSYNEVSPDAPSDVEEKGYIAPEPMASTLQLVGLGLKMDEDWPPYGPEDFVLINWIRPSVSSGIFAAGTETTLQIVCYDEDTLVTNKDGNMLYKYLTTQDIGKGFVRVKGIYTVHDLHVCDPKHLFESIEGEVEFT